MARTWTRTELITRLEQLTDTEGDAHLGTTEKLMILDSAIAETWDKIIEGGLAEKFVKSATFSTVAGTLAYSLASVVTDGDFYKLSQLYVNEGSGQMRPVSRLNPAEVQSFRPPASVVSMKIYYIPYARKLSTLTGSDTFDGINGWEEHTLMVAACAIKLKKNDSYAQFQSRKEELEERILANADTGGDEPARVVRRRSWARDPFWSISNSVNAYVLRGGNIELMYHYGYVRT